MTPPRIVALVGSAGGDDPLLQAALELFRGAEVVVLRAGPESEDQSLRRVTAARAVRLWHPVLEVTDYLGLATALAAAIRTLDARLVLAGDRGRGAVGPAVAERLDLPHLCGVLSARLGAEGLEVERHTSAGPQHLRGPAEAVLCLLPSRPSTRPQPPEDGLAEPKVEVEVLTLEQVGLSAAELLHRRRLAVGPDAPVVRG